MNNDLISRSALLGDWKKKLSAMLKDSNGAAPIDFRRVVEALKNVPAVDAVDREKLIKKLFPMGVPLTREDWNYAINARAVYAAIMGDLVEPECKTINVSLDGPIEIHIYGERK